MVSRAKAGLAIFGLASAMALVGPAFAQDAGFYVGGSLGQSQVDLDCEGTTSCDDKDTSWKIFAGYQVNRNFAVEIGYSNFGAATASTPPIGFIPAANVKIESTAWELLAIGLLPVADRFSVYGKLGLYLADTDVRVDFPPLGSATDSDDNTDLTFGIGVRYDFTRNFGVRAEWQRYSDVKAADFGESDIDVMSVGLVWKF